jgi:imidazole glycerol-phosphate synthase subunit HisH
MSSVTIVDYGVGNLLSLARAIEHAGAAAIVSADPADVERAERVILPGVGAFADGMEELRTRELVEPLRAFAAGGRPLLGICLGMQLLLDESTEFGVHEGLGLVGGTVREIPRSTNGTLRKVPHIGWSALVESRSSVNGWHDPLLDGIDQGASVYFVHSFAAEPADESICVAESVYGDVRITSVIRQGPIMGTQFHPEKSGPVGLRLIRNFVTQPTP